MKENTEDGPLGDSWEGDWDAAVAAADAAEAAAGSEPEETENESGEVSKETEPAEPSPSEEAESEEDEGAGSKSDDAEPEPEAKAEPPKEGAAPNRSERLKSLHEEAKELGLVVDASGVTKAERFEFREERRRMRGRVQEERQQFEAGMAQATANLEERSQRVSRLEAAIEGNDLDGIGKALGLAGWNELSENALKRQLNPEHQELVKLRREQRKNAEDQESLLKAQNAEAAENQKYHAREKYRTNLASGIKSLKNAKFAKFHDDPAFVASALTHQENEWDGQYTCTVEEACEKAYLDGKALYDSLAARYGDRTPSKSESAPASGAPAAEKTGKHPNNSVSQTEVASPSSNESNDELDEDAWNKRWSAQMKSAG